MMKSTFRSIAAAAAALCALAGPAAAEPQSMSLNLSAVDWSQPATALAAHARVIAASEAMCVRILGRYRTERATEAACLKETADSAVLESRHAALIALHQSLPAAQRYATHRPQVRAQLLEVAAPEN